MKLAELLHLCSISHRSGTIRFQTPGSAGFIELKSGEVWHAEWGGHHGTKAVLNMLMAHEGACDFDAQPPAGSERTVFETCDHLLLEGARLSDEVAGRADENDGAVGSLYQISEIEPAQVFHLKPGKWTLGRKEGADLVVPHHTVSSRHCSFHASADRVEIEDHQSTNGTFINGVIVTTAELYHGDVVQIGGVFFRFDAPHLQRSEPLVAAPATSLPAEPVAPATVQPLPPTPPPRALAQTTSIRATSPILETAILNPLPGRAQGKPRSVSVQFRSPTAAPAPVDLAVESGNVFSRELIIGLIAGIVVMGGLGALVFYLLKDRL